jgi:hypothetical protein
MARGGHHGGGFHGGGHHFGGGSHGSFGGGFHGGGYHGGSYYGGSGDGDIGNLIFSGIKIGILVVGFCIYEVATGDIPGMDLFTLGIFTVSVVFYVLGLKGYKRTADLYHLKSFDGINKIQVWNAEFTEYGPSSVSDKVSWAGKYDNRYRIAFFDRDFGEENVKKVRELMNRTPWIVWMNSYVWLVIGIISAISSFFFYEMVIPVFENMIMTDEAFAFIDDFVFYFPAGLTLLCAVLCFAMVKVRDSLLHKCAVRIVEDNNAAYEKMKTENYIAQALSSKWYYNNCPNCGADARKDTRICVHCGTSLEVKDIATEQVSSVHRISAAAENGSKTKTIER